MDIRDYEYIVAIAEQGGITRAAEQLFITQSALTRFLQRTEQQLGTELFLRKGKQFLLTEAGRAYVETGRKIIRLDRQLMEKLEQDVMIAKERIRLGFSMGRTSEMLQNIVPQFREKYPDIQFFIQSNTSRRLTLALQRGELDLALLTNAEKTPGYSYLPMAKSRLVLAVPQASPLAKKGKPTEGFPYPAIDLSELQGLELITLPETTNSGRIAREFCAHYNIVPKTKLQFGDVRTVLDAIDCGLGCSLFMSVPTGNKKVTYLSIRDAEAIEQVTSIVFRTDKNLTPAMKFLIQLLQKDSAIPSEGGKA